MSNWFRISHVSAGFIAVLVGYTSSAAIVFQAAAAAGATPAELGSWLWALGIGMGATCIGLSWRYRTPVLTAWSTPGAALLVTSLSGLSMPEAIGAFLFSSLLITICGITGWFERLVRILPATLASAMLAGILARFGLNVFTTMPAHLPLIGFMLASFILGRRFWPRYAVPLTLLAGIALAAVRNELRFASFEWSLAEPVLMAPHFSLSTLVGVGIPLFIVTMASQNLPGLAVLRANGYQVPASPLIGWTGATGLLLAPFGGFAFNLAAITAAICMSKDADADPGKRYAASIWAGVFYLCTGIFGATVVALFAAFPAALVTAIAGLALLGTIGNSLAGALHDEGERDAALLTFLVTASGMSLLGIGSAFWGLAFGLAVHFVKRTAATDGAPDSRPTR
ncbi:MAG TPA: benzoate/H(+) symporter BenE family transporter [Paucimonas sp.]|nr:benzoate/H(+) symporter BenE family transporter [Paucimonas sp.]